MTQQREKRRNKTWSLLGDLRRVPSEYEVVTHKMNYTVGMKPAPFEMDPNFKLNRWYLKYREGSPLQIEDWEQFREPDQWPYRRYTQQQNERETYLDGLVDRFEAKEFDAGLVRGWVEFLEKTYIPARFPMHALQMAALYLGQMAPSAYITNPATFQAADEMRRIQRLAYRAKSLSLSHYPELASSEKTCALWEQAPHWQPLRELLEKVLATYDWGETFAALNLVAKPLFDEVLNTRYAELARQNGDELMALMLDDFDLDVQRSRRWSAALVKYAVEHNPAHRELLSGWVKKWMKLGDPAVKALSRSFAEAPIPLEPEQVSAAVLSNHYSFLKSCELV
ncbi:MAG TPA: aromatic/alkene monooxygenase hydroxylase subunit beta [Chloroflexia bacterium]|nr:aromatic/alkene monooxygenase hydroxylase subunit beta [Chloroflexia bacterium]